MSDPIYATWRAPSPLRAGAAADPSLIRLMEPAILRFVGPMWPPQLLDCLAADAPAIAALVAAHETAEKEGAGWQPWADLGSRPLKLFQPSQNRSYLAVASAVALDKGLPALSGLAMPDAASPPDAARLAWNVGLATALARGSLVVRRLIPLDPDRGIDPADPVDYREFGWIGRPGQQAWCPVPSDQAGDAEERQPALALPFPGGHLHAAAIPTGHRERYLAGPVRLPEPWPPTDWDPRLEQFRHQVITPLTHLAAWDEGDEAVGLSAMVWLDLASFLRQHLPEMVDQIRFRPPWGEWLNQVWEQRAALLAGQAPRPPFSLAGAVTGADLKGLTRLVSDHLLADRDRRREMRPSHTTHAPLFVARFVLEPFSPHWPQLLSAPTRPFELAAVGEAGAPEPPPGEAPGGAELLKTLIEMILPKLPELKPGKPGKKEAKRGETSTAEPEPVVPAPGGSDGSDRGLDGRDEHQRVDSPDPADQSGGAQGTSGVRRRT